MFRQAMRALLEQDGTIEVVGEAGDGVECLRLAASLRPQVILMDLQMPRMTGVEAIRRLVQSNSTAHVVVLTTFDDDELLFDALRAGALSYLLKDASADEVASAVRLAGQGRSTLAPDVTQKVVSEFARMARVTGRPRTTDINLSDREVEVLVLLSRGSSNKEIAGAMSIAEGTVKNHPTNIYGKLGVGDRTQAALEARARGLA